MSAGGSAGSFFGEVDALADNVAKKRRVRTGKIGCCNVCDTSPPQGLSLHRDSQNCMALFPLHMVIPQSWTRAVVSRFAVGVGSEGELFSHIDSRNQLLATSLFGILIKFEFGEDGTSVRQCDKMLSRVHEIVCDPNRSGQILATGPHHPFTRPIAAYVAPLCAA